MTYLGDSGIYILSFISGLMIIFFYNSSNTNIENILIIIFLPVIDSFRLFFTRIYNGKSPFLGDENHLHHIIIKKFGFKKTIWIYIFFLYLPIILNHIFNISFVLLTAMLFVYIYFIKFLSIKKNVLKMSNLISIILPTYNSAKYIDKTIKSIFNQTYKNFELIIIDDCSTDQTVKIIDKLIYKKIHQTNKVKKKF